MAKNTISFEETQRIANHIYEAVKIQPQIGIICGTGLGGLADTLADKVYLEYADIPGFPVSTVAGHAGRLVFGYIGDRACVCMQGRFHMYEGYDAFQVTLPVRVMRFLGVEVLIVTNAAGGLNAEYKVGDFMIIKDHIFFPGLGGKNPLVGPNDERFGTRFPAMSNGYHPELRAIIKKAASSLDLSHVMREGIYVNVGGPSFETIAECRMLKLMGADVVGMSTCAEVITAVHSGMKVAGISMVTNACVTDYDDNRTANHEEVLQTGNARAKDIQRLVTKLVQLIPDKMLATQNGH